jgi:hypothetical protein
VGSVSRWGFILFSLSGDSQIDCRGESSHVHVHVHVHVRDGPQELIGGNNNGYIHPWVPKSPEIKFDG